MALHKNYLLDNRCRLLATKSISIEQIRDGKGSKACKSVSILASGKWPVTGIVSSDVRVQGNCPGRSDSGTVPVRYRSSIIEAMSTQFKIFFTSIFKTGGYFLTVVNYKERLTA